MCTSDTDTSRSMAKKALIYLLISIFCALFGAIYELFSHDVYSFYMIYAFAFPLMGGTLPYLLRCLCRKHLIFQGGISVFWHAAVATLTIGGIIQGVLEIYGTTNQFTIVYWYAAAILLLLHILCNVILYAKR